MDRIVTENLFLLEFLVDKIDLDDDCGCDEGMIGTTCISFEFLDNAPLDVCEENFDTSGSGGTPGNDSGIKRGKSCLFSLTPEQAAEATRCFCITMTVYKKMGNGWLPDKREVGTCVFSVVDLFTELINAVASQKDTPAAKTLKDTYNIVNSAGQVIGTVGVYIRMSCFGKLIVTQFQMNLNDKSVLFKDKEGHSLYRYKKAGRDGGDKRNSKSNARICPAYAGGQGGAPGMQGMRPGMGPMEGMPGMSPMGGMGGRNMQCPQMPCQDYLAQQGYGNQPKMDVPCNECDITAPCAFPVDNGASYGAGNAPCGLPDDPHSCYQEIGAKMGGNALTIRVHKDMNAIENIDTNDGDGCMCGNDTVRQPPSVISEGCAPVGSAVGSTRRPSCLTTPQNYNMQPGVNTGGQNTSPFAFKMGGCGAAAKNNVTVVPPHNTAPDGMKYTELSDPERDVFILRIGKKSEGADKKNNLELELCTPKGPELKPLPKKETRDTQYDTCDAGGSDKKEKKGKGKDKKGGKKGKKGKK